MDILVVGGTGFLGGGVAHAARAAGHAVAILTRDRSRRDLMPESEVLVGDRYKDLSSLRGRLFDAVVDTCAFTPDAVNTLLDVLSPTIGCYAFVSSASVYTDFS